MIHTYISYTGNQPRNSTKQDNLPSIQPTVLLGLYYVQVNSNGLNVLIHDDHANHFIPCVTLDCNNNTSQDILHWLRTLCRDKTLHTVDLVRNGNALKHKSKQQSFSSGLNNNNLHSTTHNNYMLMQSFLSSVKQLSNLVGTSKDLTLGHIYTDQCINIGSSNMSFIPFVVCNFSSQLPLEYTAGGLRSIPVSIMEILHFSRHHNTSSIKWTKYLIERQLMQHNKNMMIDTDTSSIEYSQSGPQRESFEIEAEKQILLLTNDNDIHVTNYNTPANINNNHNHNHSNSVHHSIDIQPQSHATTISNATSHILSPTLSSNNIPINIDNIRNTENNNNSSKSNSKNNIMNNNSIKHDKLQRSYSFNTHTNTISNNHTRIPPIQIHNNMINIPNTAG